MTKTKNTKRALFTSVLSMMLCMAMLIGSTFAWFTDTVTSGRNKIVAGNLDVELSWSTDGAKWERVTENTNMFKDTLWEPGYTRVIYLKVENIGSLALKYRLGINEYAKIIGKTAEDEDIDLAKYIKFGVVENAPVYSVDAAGRTAAINAVNDTAVTVATGYTSAGSTLAAKKETAPMALVVYMPEEVGNEANYGTGKTQPSIDLGINLVATQVSSEEDSFGNQYDANVAYPELPAVINTTVKGEVNPEVDTVLKDEAAGVMATIPAGALVGEVNHVTFNVETKASNVNSATYEINLTDQDGNPVKSAKQITVELEIGKGFKNVKVNHNDEPMASDDYSYNPATGVVTINTDSFSPFTIMFEQNPAVLPTGVTVETFEAKNAVAYAGDTYYSTLKSAVEAAEGVIYLKPNAELTETMTHAHVSGDLTIYGNGASLTKGRGEHDLEIDTYQGGLKDDVTINIYSLDGIAVWGQRYTEYTANINLYNCHDIERVYISGAKGVNNISLTNCSASSFGTACKVYSNAKGEIKVTNCSFDTVCEPINLNNKSADVQNIYVTDCTFTNCSTADIAITDAAWAAPIRAVAAGEGAVTNLYLKGNKFVYTDGKSPVNNYDVLTEELRENKKDEMKGTVIVFN